MVSNPLSPTKIVLSNVSSNQPKSLLIPETHRFCPTLPLIQWSPNFSLHDKHLRDYKPSAQDLYQRNDSVGPGWIWMVHRSVNTDKHL